MLLYCCSQLLHLSPTLQRHLRGLSCQTLCRFLYLFHPSGLHNCICCSLLSLLQPCGIRGSRMNRQQYLHSLWASCTAIVIMLQLGQGSVNDGWRCSNSISKQFGHCSLPITQFLQGLEKQTGLHHALQYKWLGKYTNSQVLNMRMANGWVCCSGELLLPTKMGSLSVLLLVLGELSQIFVALCLNRVFKRALPGFDFCLFKLWIWVILV